ncbi:unnamed protein product [Prorocentrum cordatum]|uniref:Secreted protein n=1 Tax=Prorocentrum cordatum TaxID=2364126 RepID=A0ABN9WF65_9DINO|nr:unnamed protein product [Polarella glacialis]
MGCTASNRTESSRTLVLTVGTLLEWFAMSQPGQRASPRLPHVVSALVLQISFARKYCEGATARPWSTRCSALLLRLSEQTTRPPPRHAVGKPPCDVPVARPAGHHGSVEIPRRTHALEK